jgi:AAA ATPase domain
MPGSGERPVQRPAPIIGRETGLARLHGLVGPVPQASQVLVVTGEAGMGKTVLLADAVSRARSEGISVLSVTGRESEAKLAFAGLHQLLRPVLEFQDGPAMVAGPSHRSRSMTALGTEATNVPGLRRSGLTRRS